MTLSIETSCEVELIDHMGSDITVVNAARKSFGQRSVMRCRLCGLESCSCGAEDYMINLKDAQLIRFLARGMTAQDFDSAAESIIDIATDHEQEHSIQCEMIQEKLLEFRDTPIHFAPFTHPHVQFRMVLPLAIHAQLKRHTVGIGLSEMSYRYITADGRFFKPMIFRKRPANMKQGSGKDLDEDHQVQANQTYIDAIDTAMTHYATLLALGVAPEQARYVLPTALMTEIEITGSLFAWARIINLRTDPHAQKEIRDLILEVKAHMRRLFPVSIGALCDGVV